MLLLQKAQTTDQRVPQWIQIQIRGKMRTRKKHSPVLLLAVSVGAEIEETYTRVLQKLPHSAHET